MFKTKRQWKVKQVGTKPIKKYMTKKRKAIRKKKEYGIIGVFLGLALVIILGYSNVDENEIRNRIAFAKENIQYDLIIANNIKTSEMGQILTIKPILEPTVEQVKEEIIRQAKNFELDENKMLDLAECESNFRWNAENPNSTATGVYQFLSGTWGQTESSKKGIGRKDYKANIREAMIDISNGESWRWKECLDKYNLVF